MDQRTRAAEYVNGQQSLHLYADVREAFIDVLASLPSDEYEKVTNGLILMVLHEGAVAQVMHFEPRPTPFKVVQLTTPHNVPGDILRYVIAHELGHVLQGRNWREEDDQNLEHDANATAARWGYPYTPEVQEYLRKYREPFGV